MIVVNAAWRGQRTTGQQRYASEVAKRLLSHSDVVARPDYVSANRWRAWAEVQSLALPRRDEVLLTLTSRGPLYHPRHIVTIHDHFVLSHPEWYSKQYVLTHAPVLKAQIRGASGLVFVSESTRVRHVTLFGHDTPSVVAPNGVSTPPSEAVQPWSLGKPYLLVVASADPRKNLARLIHAFLSLPPKVRRDCPLVVVGGVSEGIFAATSPAGPGDEGVVELGYVSDDLLWSLYRGARALVVPSLDEGFGLPLVEAASLGAPLVVSDIPVFRWIASDRAIYFDPRAEESIRDALHAAATEDLMKMDQATVRQRFSWDTSAKNVLEFVRRLDSSVDGKHRL